MGNRRSQTSVRRSVRAPRGATVTEWGERTHRRVVAAARWKLRTARSGGRRGGREAVLTTTGRVGTARRRGSGKQDEKVHERNQCVRPRKRRADSNLADLGRSVVHTRRKHGTGDSEAGMYRPVGRPRGRAAAYSWRSGRGVAGHLPRRSVRGERGNHPRPPSHHTASRGGGQARRRLWAVGWGGGFVVVGGRESRPHGKGSQQAGGKDAGRPGGRR
jgi:hypothetical protein